MFGYNKELFRSVRPHIYTRGSIETGPAYATANNKIVKLDFGRYPSFNDIDSAMGCLIVACSNGKLGTYSHLSEEGISRFDEFLLKLNKDWPDSRPRFGLVGMSKTTILDEPSTSSIVAKMQRSGYMLSGEVVGGYSLQRKVVMWADRLVVAESSPLTNAVEKVLSFY